MHWRRVSKLFVYFYQVSLGPADPRRHQFLDQGNVLMDDFLSTSTAGFKVLTSDPAVLSPFLRLVEFILRKSTSQSM